jgi:hypothetical protein
MNGEERGAANDLCGVAVDRVVLEGQTIIVSTVLGDELITSSKIAMAAVA